MTMSCGVSRCADLYLPMNVFKVNIGRYLFLHALFNIAQCWQVLMPAIYLIACYDLLVNVWVTGNSRQPSCSPTLSATRWRHKTHSTHFNNANRGWYQRFNLDITKVIIKELYIRQIVIYFGIRAGWKGLVFSFHHLCFHHAVAKAVVHHDLSL